MLEPRRRNISLPAAMADEMDKRPHINWSKIAQRAFQAELDKPVRDVLIVSSDALAHARKGRRA